MVLRDFPGGPVVKTPCFHCRGCGFILWGTKIPYVPQFNQENKDGTEKKKAHRNDVCNTTNVN